MRNDSILNRRIPTVFILFIILVGTVSTIFITGKTAIFFGGAAPSEVPQNVKITNISDTSFTVNYTTDIETLGSVSYGRSQSLGTTTFDDRDQTTETPHQYTTHIITLKKLTPDTQYYFSITSGGKTYLNNNLPYTIQTGRPLTTTTSSQFISGTVNLPTDNNGNGALVYAQTPASQILSTITDPQGNYRIALNTLRSADLTQYISVTNTDTIAVLITDGNATSHIITTLQSSPMPTTLLSQDYDFTNTNLQPTQQPPNNSLFPLFSQALNTRIPAIIVPSDNQNFVDQQPEFKGITQPSAPVSITIRPGANQTQITADSSGQWTFRPSNILPPETYTITVNSPDESGAIQTLTKTFVILTVGSQVFEVATPSATMPPTATPAQTNTPIPTTTPTLTATSTLTPTINPTTTITPTIMAMTSSSPTILPTATVMPTTITNNIPSPTKAPLPSTGNESIFVIGIASIITTIIGFGLFFLTRGGNI